MSKCFNFTASASWCFRSAFTTSGLRSTVTDLGDGTTMHCWVPKTRKPTRPNLVLIHGFGINAMWQWWETVRILAPKFNVYVPDLVFFGDSFTTRPDRSESFQAQCVKRVMDANSVEKMSVVGISYGGFVAYSMAAQFRESVEKVVICCSGVCLEEKDVKEGLFPVKNVEEAADILVPLNAEKMKELMSYTFVKPPKGIPACLLEDFIDLSFGKLVSDDIRIRFPVIHLTSHQILREMCSHFVNEKKELLGAIPKDRKLSDIPRITQPTLILWGDQDQIFPVELAHRLKRHLGDNAQLVVIEGTGHAFGFEKPKDYHNHLKNFLLG